MPKKWVTIKEYVDKCGKKIVANSFGVTVSCINNYLYKGTEPSKSIKIIAGCLGVKDWWIGEVPIPPKIKRFKKDIKSEIVNTMSETKEKQDIANTTTDDILGTI